uniref:Uncharacterized protein n=1 Tax=Glossina austeni TaxID=7395 RepID=A0A1A9V4W1_GLOAU
MNAQQFSAFLKPQYLVAQVSQQIVRAASSSVAQTNNSNVPNLNGLKWVGAPLHQHQRQSSKWYPTSSLETDNEMLCYLARLGRKALKKRLAAMSDDPSSISKKFEEYRASRLQSGKSCSEQYLGG